MLQSEPTQPHSATKMQTELTKVMAAPRMDPALRKVVCKGLLKMGKVAAEAGSFSSRPPSARPASPAN